MGVYVQGATNFAVTSSTATSVWLVLFTPADLQVPDSYYTLSVGERLQ
jgi:hypothetical protein